LNLAVNARDAMPEGGRLTVGSSLVDGEALRSRFPEAHEEKYVEVCIQDSGVGMDEETRSRIFEPFFTTKGTGGQGLGLAVVYGIINGHRGFIDVASAAGKGTTFRIYLPASDHGGPAGDPEPAKRRRRSSDPAAERRGEERVRADAQAAPTVLLVEDEEALLAPIRDLLEEEGYSVLTAVDGIEAVETHARHADRISAVLLDLSLPRLGGWQAFLKMRERDPKLRCIIASGNIDAEQRAAMNKLGVDVSIRKPYGSAEMLQAIRKVLSDA
jgi:CheY-like chemotaxis protein